MNSFRRAILDSFAEEDGSIPADIATAIRLSENISSEVCRPSRRPAPIANLSSVISTQYEGTNDVIASTRPTGLPTSVSQTLPSDLLRRSHLDGGSRGDLPPLPSVQRLVLRRCDALCDATRCSRL